MKKSLLLIIILTGILLAQPIITANVLKTKSQSSEEREVIHAKDDITFVLGKMEIIGDDRSIELYEEFWEKIIRINDVGLEDLDRTVKFIVYYRFKESTWSFDEDEWKFSLNLFEFGASSGHKMGDTKTFKDTWGKTDSGKGELCVYMPLKSIWGQRYNDDAHVRLRIRHVEDPSWTGNLTYFHEKEKCLKIKTDLPDHHIKIIPNDGTNFGEIKLGESKTKSFTIKSITPYKIEGHVGFVEETDSFITRCSETAYHTFFSIDSLGSIEFDVTFTPKDDTTYVVTFFANAKDWVLGRTHTDQIILEATGKGKARSLDYGFGTNINNLIERFPLLQKILTRT